MVADLVMKQDMADVTIYGKECEFCGEVCETIDSLVKHMVNDHDQLWDYGKQAEESLRRIKLDKKILKDLIGGDHSDSVEGGGSIKCRFCVKRFGILDGLARHVLMDHPDVALGAYKSGGLYLSAEFLTENGFVENFDEYCATQNKNERSVVEHSKIRSDSISKHWEDIDSGDEWDWEIDENEVKDWVNKNEIVEDEIEEVSKDTETQEFVRSESSLDVAAEIEVLREDPEKTEELCESSAYCSAEVERLSDTSSEKRLEDEFHPCESCGEVYNNDEDLESHVKRHHEKYGKLYVL